MRIRSWTVSDLIRRGESYLTKRGVPNARRNSEWLLAHALGRHSTELYLESNRVVVPLEIAAFGGLLERRGKREPLQYILRSTEFMSLPFDSLPGVFIPRPDTELLVERVERHLRNGGNGVGLGNRPRFTRWRVDGSGDVRVADLCCGSGVIAVSLAKRNPHVRATAVDVSRAAVDLTTRNALRHEVNDRVECVLGNAIEFLASSRERYTAIVCNPPYIRCADLPSLSPEIRLHEPRVGLDGGPDGLDFYRQATPLLKAALTPGGIAAFEIGAEQGPGVRELLDRESFDDIQVYQDYSGCDRVVIARSA